MKQQMGETRFGGHVSPPRKSHNPMKIHNFSEDMTNLNVNFFLNLDAMSGWDKKTVDGAKGHLILFNSYDMEDFLKVAALLDGSSVDFLLGSSKNGSDNSGSRIKVNNVKKFIRSLDTNRQNEVAKYYTQMYRAVTKYHKNREEAWCCGCCGTDYKQVMMLEIENALVTLRKKLGEPKK